MDVVRVFKRVDLLVDLLYLYVYVGNLDVIFFWSLV